MIYSLLSLGVWFLLFTIIVHLILRIHLLQYALLPVFK